jgi:hypothetical membrane protein
MNPWKWPLGTKAGISLVLVYVAFTSAAWRLFPTSYSPFENWISDLGNSEYNPTGHILFNLGCVATGILGALFIFSLRAWRTGSQRQDGLLRLAQYLGALGSGLLVLVGVFSEDYPPYHGIFSVAFFATFGVFILIFVPAVFPHPKFIRLVGVFGYAALAIDIVLGAISREPILEWATVSGFLLFVGLLSVNMLRIDAAPQAR